MTAQDRARQMLELDESISPGPYKKCGEDMYYWVENAIGQEVEEFRDKDMATFFAATRTLAPELARDVLDLSHRLDAECGLSYRLNEQRLKLRELLALTLPYAAHIPAIAERARELGLLAEPTEDTVQALRDGGVL